MTLWCCTCLSLITTLAAPAAEHGASGKTTSKTTSPAASAGTHWSYEGDTGPEHWGELDKAYAACSSGKQQSPVDVAHATSGELTPLVFNYRDGGYEVVNNGHTIQVNYKAGNTLKVAGKRYELKQFHFHAPSENMIDGAHFPMELHLVHADAEGHLAVVGVMIEQGAWNREVSKAWLAMPQEEGSNAISNLVNAGGLLPKDRAYYRFAGSLTTPPCTEGVTWLLLKQHITLERKQIVKFMAAMHHDNNRPVQPLQGRVIEE